MNELIGSITILVGAIFLFLGGLGVFRMPDSFNRIQAGTKASTMGTLLVLWGVGLYHPAWAGKLILLLLFIVLTNPISSHALARAAYSRGMAELTVVDKLQDNKEDTEKEEA